jgi:hypothetical protein
MAKADFDRKGFLFLPAAVAAFFLRELRIDEGTRSQTPTD